MFSGASANHYNGSTFFNEGTNLLAKTVTDGSIPHNVTFKGFGSKTKTSGSYTVRFSRGGTYSYRCTIHPGMKGHITVK